jgi:hypothetical protein
MFSSKDIEREGDAIDAGWEVLAGEANRVMPGNGLTCACAQLGAQLSLYYRSNSQGEIETAKLSPFLHHDCHLIKGHLPYLYNHET